MSSAETSTGVAREHSFSISIFSCSHKIPTWSSNFRLSRCMRFRTFRKRDRLRYWNSVLRGSLIFLREEPDFHYKHSSRSLFRLLEAQGEHCRGHLPFVIRLVELSCTTCPKTKLRELSFWHVVSLHRCSTFLFLEFNDDITNHPRTLTTASFLRKNSHWQRQRKITLKMQKRRQQNHVEDSNTRLFSKIRLRKYFPGGLRSPPHFAFD